MEEPELPAGGAMLFEPAVLPVPGVLEGGACPTEGCPVGDSALSPPWPAQPAPASHSTRMPIKKRWNADLT
jgi:hypothetical protein